MIHIVYVLRRCTDPEWHGTFTEQNRLSPTFYSSTYIPKSVIFITDICTSFYKSTLSTISAVIETDNKNEFA